LNHKLYQKDFMKKIPIEFHQPYFDQLRGCWCIAGSLVITAWTHIEPLPKGWKGTKEPPPNLAPAKQRIENILLEELKKVISQT